MKTMHSQRLLAVLMATVMGTSPVFAAPPWKGGGGDDRAQTQEGKSRKMVEDNYQGSVLRVKDAAGGGGGGGGGGHSGGGGGGGKASRSAPAPQPGAYFTDRNRQSVHAYYAESGRGGKACPPGLAKKNNGCMPPGQAKKWRVGQPLPADVAWTPPPPQVIVNLPPVPVGHKYVQVAGDILLIAVGTKMVVDGISGLSGR